MSYSLRNALIYQLTEFIERFMPGFIHKTWVKKMRDYYHEDWAEWRTELVMKDLDRRIEDLHALWKIEEEEKNQPIYSEKASDGSEAQELLGGEMRLTSPWTSEREP